VVLFTLGQYTVAGRAIGFALEQPLHVVAFVCSALGISKQLEYNGNSCYALSVEKPARYSPFFSPAEVFCGTRVSRPQ
jgi:hypothetical protein